MSVVKLVYRMVRSNSRVIKVVLYRLIRFVYSCDFDPDCKVGEGISLLHNGLGSVIYAKSIGDNTQIYQNVTIGAGFSRTSKGFPTIGKNCRIFSGSVIAGKIEIGDNTIIGAKAVVTKSTPPHSIVAGIPATVKRIMTEDDPYFRK